MTWTYDDGGRKAAGYAPCGDCVTRAIAIAMQRDYAEVRRMIRENQTGIRRTRKTRGKLDGSDGVYTKRKWFQDWMKAQGWLWTPTMQVGQGCKVHLRRSELPGGRLIVVVSKHWTTMIDGVIHDTHNPSRGGTRCVYGYWRRD